MSNIVIDHAYNDLFQTLKKRVQSARYQAALKVNRELILLYHFIGTEILASQAKHGWGAKVIDQLSRDFKAEF